jgi:hypothetical protein
MTLDLSMTDGASGELLMAVVDRQRDFRETFLEWRTSVSNQADARRMVQRWTRAVQALL